MDQRRFVKICNPEGLHARPCHAIVAIANRFESSLEVRSGTQRVNGKSILQLMTLAAGPGDELELVSQGADADSLLSELIALVEAGFGETS